MQTDVNSVTKSTWEIINSNNTNEPYYINTSALYVRLLPNTTPILL